MIFVNYSLVYCVILLVVNMGSTVRELQLTSTSILKVNVFANTDFHKFSLRN